MNSPSIVLILGSGPNAPQVRNWARPARMKIAAINNAWQACEDWDYLVHAGDFPKDRMPGVIAPTQQIHSYESYVPAQNRFGGFVYGGGTMAFTAGYWALDALKPDILAYFGCDMTYCGTKTHFYGQGAADPLRDDITLQSLEAKSIRLMALAARQNCLCVNLSDALDSRLMFPRATLAGLRDRPPLPHLNQEAVEAALMAEDALGYFVESGEYWHQADQFDDKALSHIDDIWLTALADQNRLVRTG